MPFVPAKCTNCGANLNVNSENDAAVCPYCKTAFIVEKAINNYITNNVTNIDHLYADTVTVNDSSSPDNLARSGDTFIKLGNFSSAEKCFSEMVDKYPFDYRGWIGLIAVGTRNYSYFDITKSALDHLKEYHGKASLVASPEEKVSYQSTVEQYFKSVDSALEAKKAEWNNRLSYLEHEKERLEEENKNKQDMLECRLKELKAHQPAQRAKIWFFILLIVDILLVVEAGFEGALGPALGCMFFIFGPIEYLVLEFADGKNSPFSKWESKVSNLEMQIEATTESYRKMITPVLDEMSYIKAQSALFFGEESK